MNGHGPQALRNKAVYLLYLIFLVLVFTFIPSDFIASVDRSNDAFKALCLQSQEQTSAFSTLAMGYLKADEDVYQKTNNQINHIDEVIQEQSDNIDILIDELELASQDQAASISLTRSQQASNDLLLNQRQAQQLFKALSELKTELYRFIEPEDIDLLDTLLPLHEFEYNADGQPVQTDAFYFENYPLTISVLNLIGFKARLGLIHNLTTYAILTNALSEANLTLPDEVLNTFNLGDGLSNPMAPIETDQGIQPFNTIPQSNTINHAPIYKALLNPLHLTTYGVFNPDDWDIDVNQGSLHWINKQCYIIPDNLDKLRVQLSSKQDGAVNTLIFEVLNTPTATIGLSGFEQASMPQSVARNARLTSVITHGIEALESVEIESFELSIIYKHHTGILQPIRNTSNTLNAASVKALSTIQQGDKLLLTDVVGKLPNGNEINVLPITYNIQ